jgi:hypothetical protein|tara:strand:- start:2457 stop:2723 length:267 start_codon:yes stop_codon:yes gene_type:complete
VRFLFDRIRNLITSDSTMLVETDDSWFNGMDMPLLGGARQLDQAAGTNTLSVSSEPRTSSTSLRRNGAHNASHHWHKCKRPNIGPQGQ